MRAIILAGGKGTRLMPYTTILPKPLLPIGNKPILDIVIRQLISYEINKITLAVGYLAELIIAYFGDGSKYGIKIDYSKEEKPLGTAAPLARIKGLNDTFLVMNGDVLTSLNYQKLVKFHKQNHATATLGIHKRKVKMDFGVIKSDSKNRIIDYTEKPILNYSVSMGINILEPTVLKYIKKNERLDFPELNKRLIANNEKVMAYITDDYWLDIGRPDDYNKAQNEFITMRDKFIKKND